jgi:hypothetical protein
MPSKPPGCGSRAGIRSITSLPAISSLIPMRSQFFSRKVGAVSIFSDLTIRRLPPALGHFAVSAPRGRFAPWLNQALKPASFARSLSMLTSFSPARA